MSLLIDLARRDVGARQNQLTPRPDPTSVLAVDRLTVSFGAEAVVAGVSYTLHAGRTLGVVGESGCGKSMTALALLGLVPAPGRVAGSIRFAGQELVGQTARVWQQVRGLRVAMVFQDPIAALNPVMTIGRQIAEVMVLHQGLHWREAKRRAVAALARVGMTAPESRARSFPHQLSGGMRQRAMMAMALACRPAVLIADEPTTALDVTIAAQVLELMQSLQDEIGMAIQFISHNLAVISEVADEIIVMYAGRIVEHAPAAALFARPAHPYTRGLIATMPDPDRRLARLPVVAGSVADQPATPGCRFAPRCHLAQALCWTREPELAPFGDAQSVACFMAGRDD